MAHVIDSEVFQAFTTYAIIVILKMMFMGVLTVYYRISRKAFANTEDTHAAKNPEEKKKMLQPNEDVERTRRCHHNDLENILPFMVIGFLYTLTGPELSSALLHFRLFVGSRFVHTLAYMVPLPHHIRGLSWILGMLVSFCMAYQVLSAVLRL